MKLKAALLSAISILLLSQGASAANLAANGDFEEGMKSWGKEGSPEPATIERDAPYSGKYSAKLYREGEGNVKIYNHGIVGFDPKKACKISLAVKCEGAQEDDLSVRLLCIGEDGKPLRWAWLPAGSGMHDLLKSGGTHPWKTLECALSPACYPDGTAKAMLFIDRKRNGEGIVWIDEVSVENLELSALEAPKQEPKAPAPQERKSPTPSKSVPNLIPGDSSFETGIQGWNARRDAGKAWHGEASMEIPAGATGASSPVFLKILKPKQAYFLTFMACAESPCELKSVISNQQTWTYVGSASSKLGKEWSKVVLRINPQPDSASIRFFLSKQKEAKVWIDALELNAGGAPADYSPSAPFSIGVDGSSAPGGISFCDEDAPALFLRARNDSGADAEASLSIATESYDGSKAERFAKRVLLKNGETQSFPFKALDSAKRGFYAIRATLSAEGRAPLKASASFAIVDRPLAPSPKSFFGLHPGVSKEALARIGVNWTRDFRMWKYIKSEQGRFEIPESWFDTGFNIMNSMKITEAPAWALDPKGGLKNPEDYTEFIKQSVEASKGRCAYWEFENEPDLTFPKFLKLGTEDAAAAYAKMVRDAAMTVKALQPEAKTMAAGVSGGDFNTGFPFVKRCLKDAGAFIDIVPVHPYANARYIGPEASDIGPDLNKTLEKTRELRKIIAEAGGKQEIWFGEIGWALDLEEDVLSPSALRHGEYLAKLMLLAKAAGVEKVMYFLADSCIEKERYYYGIWRNGAPLPAAAAYAASAQNLEGASFKEDIMDTDLKAYSYVSRDGVSFAAIWLERGAPVKASIATKASNVEIRDIFNNPLAPNEVNGRCGFVVGASPLYIYGKGLKSGELSELLKSGAYECPPVKCEWRAIDAAHAGLTLRSLRVVPLEGKISFSVEGQPASGKEISFSLRPGQEASYEFALQGGLDGRKLSAEIASSAGNMKSEYSVGLHPCPYLKKGMATSREDFARLASITLDSRESLLPNDPEVGWTGPENLSVKALVGWDEAYLYLFAEVRDDIHCQGNSRGHLWAGDSIQIAIDPNAEAAKDRYEYGKNDYEITAGLTKDGPDSECDYIYEKGRAGSFNDSVKREIVRDGDKTFYRIGIPWSGMKAKAKESMVFGFNFIVNDDDGRGRRYWLGVTPGIGEMKYTWPYWKFRLDPPK